MNCGNAQQAVLLAQSGELAAKRQSALDTHLAACPACRTYQADLSRMVSVSRDTPLDEEISEFTLRRIEAAAARSLHPSGGHRNAGALLEMWRPALIAGAAACLLLLLALTYTLRDSVDVAQTPAPESPDPPPRTAGLGRLLRRRVCIVEQPVGHVGRRHRYHRKWRQPGHPGRRTHRTGKLEHLMKTPRILLVLLVTATITSAQPPPNAPPRPDMPGPEGPREARRPLDRWMNQMQQTHPEDHARLMQLKETDPEAFQAELRTRRDRLRNRNLEAGMAEMPRFREMMEEMPPEEREDMAERFSRMMRSQYKHPGRDHRQVAAAEQKTRELAKAYQAAPEVEKDTLRAELRTQIEQVFALRDEQNQRQIEEAEKNLQRLKDTLGKRRGLRKEIVERRLRELTEGDLSARQRPRPEFPLPPD